VPRERFGARDDAPRIRGDAQRVRRDAQRAARDAERGRGAAFRPTCGFRSLMTARRGT
jgi:hypothetical protein